MTKLVHCQKEKYDILIGRPSKWGNPFTHIQHTHTLAQYVVATREEAISSYREYILNNTELLNSLHELEGKILGCWCIKENDNPIPYVCHGQILLELISQNKIKKLFGGVK